MSVRIIGDVHGKYSEYEQIASGAEYSVCLGDFGFADTWNRLHYSWLSADKHKVIAGNHDCYDYAPHSSHYLGDFGECTLGGIKFFFIRGGISINRVSLSIDDMRDDTKSWCSQEELNLSQMLDCMRAYDKSRPDIVLSHVPCASFSKIMSPSDQILQDFGFHKGFKENHQLLGDELLKIHQPSLWFSGHFHIKMSHKIGNTNFVGLAELGYVDLNVNDKV
jgi:predicted phosphodiesterase